MRSLTYRYETVRLPSTGAEVPDTLASICDVCGTVVGIPTQSLPKLREVRQVASSRKIEARIPKELDDALGLIAHRLNARSKAFRGAVVRYYMYRVAHDVHLARRVSDLAASPGATGTPGGRLAIRVDQEIFGRAMNAVRESGLKSESALYRGIILVALQDVFETKAPEDRAALQAVAAIV